MVVSREEIFELIGDKQAECGEHCGFDGMRCETRSVWERVESTGWNAKTYWLHRSKTPAWYCRAKPCKMRIPSLSCHHDERK